MDYNYQITIEYDGTKYVGWQFQKNGLSIQGSFRKKLKKLFKKKLKLLVPEEQMLEFMLQVSVQIFLLIKR